MENEERPPGVEPEAELARLRAEQGIEWLLEGLFYACLDWIEKGEEPELDPARLQQAADRGLGAMVRSFREALVRRGLDAAEVDRRMGWPAGRTEQVLARPSELGYGEQFRFADMLGVRLDRCFEDRTKKREAGEKGESGMDEAVKMFHKRTVDEFFEALWKLRDPGERRATAEKVLDDVERTIEFYGRMGAAMVFQPAVAKELVDAKTRWPLIFAAAEAEQVRSRGEGASRSQP